MSKWVVRFKLWLS